MVFNICSDVFFYAFKYYSTKKSLIYVNFGVSPAKIKIFKCNTSIFTFKIYFFIRFSNVLKNYMFHGIYIPKT